MTDADHLHLRPPHPGALRVEFMVQAGSDLNPGAFIVQQAHETGWRALGRCDTEDEANRELERLERIRAALFGAAV